MCACQEAELLNHQEYLCSLILHTQQATTVLVQSVTIALTARDILVNAHLVLINQILEPLIVKIVQKVLIVLKLVYQLQQALAHQDSIVFWVPNITSHMILHLVAFAPRVTSAFLV